MVMKKSLSFLVVLLTVGSVTYANAVDNPSSSMAVLKNGTSVKLLYKGAEQNDVKVLIFDEDNRVVFSEKIKKTNGFARPYNFSKLPEGNYRIQIVDNTGSKTEEIAYHEEKQINRSKLMHVVRLSGSTDKFVLSVPNKQKETLTVAIYGEDNVLYTGSEIVSGDFARIYNLKDYSGPVTFKVTDSRGLTNSLTR
jgi:hypothetical protein